MINYLRQGLLIFGFTLLGEALEALLPLPIPAAIYGLVFLFLALCLKLVKVEHVKEFSGFLLTIMPILFVAPTVNLLESWGLLLPNLGWILLLIAASTILVFAVSGIVCQAVCKKEESHE
jgi:holin-like protein